MLEIVDLPDPHPGPAQVRIAVRAAGEMETGLHRLEQADATDPGAPAPADPAPLLTLERRGLLDVAE